MNLYNNSNKSLMLISSKIFCGYLILLSILTIIFYSLEYGYNPYSSERFKMRQSRILNLLKSNLWITLTFLGKTDKLPVEVCNNSL